ncbi:MAG: hypothetical protein GY765_40205 [bacterium]|nr:hypothetical protein [bacterium]
MPTESNTKNYAFFPGCTIPLRGRQYELSAKEVARHFGINIEPLQDFACCGFPIKSASREANLVLAARNLAVAEEAGRDIVALCSSCATVLAETAQELQDEPGLLERVNKKLAEVDRKITKVPSVTHWAKFFNKEIGTRKLAESVTRSLDGFRFAVHYGCHYVKPSRAFPDGEDPEAPYSISDLLKATGAEVVSYPNADKCCGGAILGIREDIALSITGNKLKQLAERKVDALVVVCPFCSVMYDDNQKKAAAHLEMEFNVPVLYLSQVLGLALGMSPKAVGLKMNKNKSKRLIETFSEK